MPSEPASEPLMMLPFYFRHMFGVGVLDVVLLFVYYLFRFNYLFVMMMEMEPDGNADWGTRREIG